MFYCCRDILHHLALFLVSNIESRGFRHATSWIHSFFFKLILFPIQKSNSCKDSSKKFLPSSFEETWVFNDIRNIGENDIQLRNHEQIQPVHSTLTSLDIFPLFNFPKIWQDFPDKQIKITRKTTEFDAKLKTFFLNDLSETSNCNRLLCPACLAGRIGWEE